MRVMFLQIHRWSSPFGDRGEVQDVVIVSCFVGYNETSKAYKIYIHTTKDYGELRCEV
jgi:hypothetical protein